MGANVMGKVEKPAGFWVRLGALIIDSLVLGFSAVIIAWLIHVLFEIRVNTDSPGFSLGDLAYGILLPLLWYGYTLGKRVYGIRIVRIDGKQLTLWTLIKRNIIGGLVYIFTLGIGLIISALMVGLREDKRSIHDLIAGTYVTYQSDPREKGDPENTDKNSNENEEPNDGKRNES